MKKFLEYIKESNYIYHGTTKQFDKPIANKDEYMMDRAIGTHFATDPKMAGIFANGMYNGDRNGGRVIKTRMPKNSELERIKQKKYKNGNRQSDQAAVGAHVGGTVFSQPEHKELFKQWAMHHRRIDEPTAEDLHSHLMAGKAPSDKTKFGSAYSNDNNFRDYVSNFNYNVNGPSNFRHSVIRAFHDIMAKKGKKGLIYKNTSPNETQGIRSIKSVILFHPHEHDYEDHQQ